MLLEASRRYGPGSRRGFGSQINLRDTGYKTCFEFTMLICIFKALRSPAFKEASLINLREHVQKLEIHKTCFIFAAFRLLF